jgi:hypothetical protein
MDPSPRAHFNARFDDLFFAHVRSLLHARVGPVPFRLAETPLFLDVATRAALLEGARDIVALLLEPGMRAMLEGAVPAEYDVPGEPPMPDCVQVDFALADDGAGNVVPRLVELQAFPSLYAFETVLADVWAEALEDVPGLRRADRGRDWTCFFEGDRATNLDRVRRAILGGEEPEHVVLVDFEPESQKTLPDFVATRELFGVEYCCVTELIVDGRSLFREREGRRVPVRRIYNRMVFDELRSRDVRLPFRWHDSLDVTWCSHPNWYWIWSKYALPHLDHPMVPRARFLDTVPDEELAGDLSRFVLKPLFSFAGAGVVVDVTREAISRIPRDERGGWLLQEKIAYAEVIRAPEGFGVKAEVRVMFVRDPVDDRLYPVLPLVRLSRGKLLGVDHNRDLTWVGASVGMW